MKRAIILNFDERNKYAQLFERFQIFLSEHQKKIITMYLIEDNTYQEIADFLKITKSAVADAIKKTLKKLAKFETIMKQK